jgi:hypothetical protein
MKKTLYEVLNIDLANEHTKARKLAVVDSISSLLEPDVDAKVREAISAMDIPEDDERYHWIQTIARKAAADLLTIGKVQPEHMLEMSSLPREDFSECVKVATLTARSLNDLTIAAEKDLNTDTISNEIV